jgi:4-hydroxybenzoate polyprenyltransferase
MKRELAAAVLDLRNAPMSAPVRALIDRRATDGAEIVLATGADEHIAAAIAADVPAVTRILASDGTTNLTGKRKADLLVERYGERGFDYVGNSSTDIAVWRHSDRRYLATRRPYGIPAWARGEEFTDILRDPAPSGLRTWARGLRVHQSLKNLLLFLPLIAAHEVTDLQTVLRAAIGFIAFSLMAFSVYLLNDTLDIPSDRAHPRKRRRPIAAGWISPLTAIGVAGVLAVVSLVIAIFLGGSFLAVLIVYAALTTSYSFWFKRVALVDIVVLALLYMIRIVAGAVVTDIPLSFWFTAVSLFLFLSLALVKRYAEAHQARSDARAIHGRGYAGDDIHAILALGTSSGVAAVLLTAIYIQSDSVAQLYPAPAALWLVIPLLFYWVANLWLKAGRGLMHDDPLVFALKDRASLVAAALVVLVFVAASLPSLAVYLERVSPS